VGTRSVRGATGATFEVDAAMLAPTLGDAAAGYRVASAVPSVRDILPAPTETPERTTWTLLRVALAFAVLGSGAVIASALVVAIVQAIS
jgi:hypothetical protein